MRLQLLFMILVTAAFVPELPGQSADKPKLRVGYAQSVDEARKELEGARKALPDLASWEKRRRLLRQRILSGAKLTRLPKRHDLNPVFAKKRKYDGYQIENVAFESYPGFFVTGSLYRPTDHKGKLAIVLSPHGHDGRFKFERQKRMF